MADLHIGDQGHKLMLDVLFGAVTAPSNFYIALLNDTVTGTDDWSDVSANEISSGTNTGYAQVTINRDQTADGFAAAVLDSAEMWAVGKQAVFTAGALWVTAITAVVLVANLATDKLVGYANVSSYILGSGETYKVTPKIKLTKV